jgi:SAM-dependent methyltransferase
MTSDTFGQACLDYWNDGQLDRTVAQELEFDDGTRVDDPLGRYFAPEREWSEAERELLRLAEGSALDLGVGVGRFALELQERGREVLGVDVSPGALLVARARGLRHTELADAASYLRRCHQQFDTVLLMGNNVGLVGRTEHIHEYFGLMAGCLRSGGVLLGTAGKPAGLPSAVVVHNQAHGRAPGESTMRTCYRAESGPWFDYLFLDLADLLDRVDAQCWQLHPRLVETETLTLFALIRK